MAVTDPIADMLTVIRNASFGKKNVAEVKNSGICENIMKILKSEGFISDYRVIKDSRQGLIRIYLKYGKDGTPALTGIKRISKPGLRIYKSNDALPRVYGGLGVAIISTSQGLMTDTAARTKKVGGEVVCYAW